ncbi:divalent-cation tolerance protein CutA [Micromonospora sp. NBC_01813]|uniref:divalent-cation tolerance protein CutA n=1 Tax=Micromonospora sp. NBC_01813 TaxID=2975988 RepID=UPI002DDBABAD|nr:divalent-cation tolerance protein CutA [Micromonospora sp. NBC_01813]WSA07287.1 divalent-cation tolerance protein CutA [Micromonospora sp. NBC_01813]
MSDYLQVSTAAESREAAVALARSAVGARLAGNAQVIGPVISVFWHLGNQGEGEEWQVLLNTTASRYQALERHLLTHHPWQKPQIIATAIVAGSAACLEWIKASTDDAAPGT